MKELNELYKKYEGLIKLVIMFAPLLFAGYKYLGTYMYVPQRMDSWEGKAKRDSLHYEKIIKSIMTTDSLQDAYLKQDVDSIADINVKLRKNYIQ